MKRTLSLILAALLLASSMTACGTEEPKETEKPFDTTVTETNAPDTNSPATETPETDSPVPVYPYDTSLITENGVAKAHIVLLDGASANEQSAAEELRYHIQLVSGAEVAVTNSVQSDSLPIIIATPDSLPELETLFPEDLAWLRDIGEVGDTERWGDDGFAIRLYDNKLYIFGATSRGALNGVYDFIEDTLGVLWIRADESIGLIYDEMATVTVAKTNYREKSPFMVRGVSLYGANADFTTTDLMFTRNKYNCGAAVGAADGALFQREASVGLEPFISNPNVKWWLATSPLYDPKCKEYWATDDEGNHVGDYNSTTQVNYWSELTADTVAASVIQALDTYGESVGLRHVGVCMQDYELDRFAPDDTLPFEYAPGEFVYPGDEDYVSTVYFSFINRIARQVKEKHPEAYVNTYGYSLAICPPRCDIEDNVIVVFCHFNEDLTQSIEEPFGDLVEQNYNCFTRYLEKTPNVISYNYYGCYFASGWYERPIWYRIQEDLQYYAAHGNMGMTPTIYADIDTRFEVCDTNWGHSKLQIWEMNLFTNWLYAKLAWNPNENIEELLIYFCDKVYGDASPYMQEYYRLVQMGWKDGSEYISTQFNANHRWSALPASYYDNFLDVEVDGVHILTGIREALENAWNAADEKTKVLIERPRYAFNNWESFTEKRVGDQ